MEKVKLLEIVENAKDKSNKDLFEAEDFLYNEFEKTKSLVIELTRHMDAIEDLHVRITKEIQNRKTAWKL